MTGPGEQTRPRPDTELLAAGLLGGCVGRREGRLLARIRVAPNDGRASVGAHTLPLATDGRLRRGPARAPRRPSRPRGKGSGRRGAGRAGRRHEEPRGESPAQVKERRPSRPPRASFRSPPPAAPPPPATATATATAPARTHPPGRGRETPAPTAGPATSRGAAWRGARSVRDHCPSRRATGARRGAARRAPGFLGEGSREREHEREREPVPPSWKLAAAASAILESGGLPLACGLEASSPWRPPLFRIPELDTSGRLELSRPASPGRGSNTDPQPALFARKAPWLPAAGAASVRRRVPGRERLRGLRRVPGISAFPPGPACPGRADHGAPS